ncbi:MMPL family transporter [Iocasia frigidifontis]|uniref:MMPL family transporter n=1 Tax=Iocasia fonsfrigidae TaxID=2682810 RepID=A0A8A7KLM6_9FIRM|nr:efflux RND transporter permease subunit [Iocasia fonsfrigidae]QTL98742.1 MMPL family transporter [Iocasia fonsfrigidae]
MKISNFSVDRPVTITMIILAVILIGTMGLVRLSLQQLPDIDVPFLVIYTIYSGASPEEVEESITRPIEENIATLSGLDTLSSTSYEGYSLLRLEMEYGTDVTEAKNDLRDLISRMSDSLPDDADDPQIMTYDLNSQPIIRLSISGENLVELKDIAKNKFKPSLEKIVGVASVDISGGLEREININVNQEQMLGYGLTLNDIASGIKLANSNLSVGSIDEGDKEISLRAEGKFKSVAEIKKITILSSTGEKIPLSEFADVEDTFAEQNDYNFLNGKQSLGLAIRKEGDSNTVDVARDVLAELDSLKKELPNVDVFVVRNNAENIENSVSNVGQNFILGGILAVIILFLFLRNIQSTIVIATAIPTSVIATFALMYFGKLTLNMMSLGGLALGVGMLLDNSIVVLENIYRHRLQGAGKIEAAKEGASEVATAIIASTLTTVAVFLPVVFIQDMLAQLFTPLSLTVAFSLLASLFVALTFVPMLSSKLLHVKEKHRVRENGDSKFGAVKGVYHSILSLTLKHRYLVVAVIFIGLVFFGLGVKIGLIPLKMEYMPSSDQGSINVYLDLPENTRVEKSVSVLKKAEAKLKNIPEIDVVNSSAEENNVEIDLELLDLNQRKRSVDQVAEEVRNRLKDLAGVKIYVAAQNSMMGSRGKGGGDIKINIHGADLQTLSNLSAIIMEQVKATPGTRNIAVSLEDSRAEIKIIPKRKIAKELGFTESGIASAVDDAVDGTTVSTYTEGGEEYDIVLKLEKKQVNTIDKLKELKITSTTGITVPLEQVAGIKKGIGYNTIERENQERVATVSAGIYNRALGDVQAEIERKINSLSIPSGYTITYSGDADDMKSSFGQLASAMILAIILVYMVMAAQFESLIHPFVVMFTVPLSLVGAVLGLTLTGISLSVQGFIGVIMLVGIVVNNAIVMIDYINARRQTEDRKEAILAAGQIRIRPIMMTTLTTVLAMVPMALGIGEGAEQQQPMAIVVIAGLLFSTMLTLIVIPVLYDIVDDIVNSIRNKVKKAIST